jgi:hypothetical protein
MKDKYFIPDQEYKKCAPSIAFSEGSCFSLKELLYIAKSYNKYLKNQKVIDIKRYISLTDSKIDLVSELSNRLIEEMPEFSKNYSKLYLLFRDKHLRLIDKTLLDYGVNENSTIIAYIRFFQDIF